MVAHLACVEMVVENECAQDCAWKSLALTYALALRSDWPTDWKRVNAAISAKFGVRGLVRIKTLAWAYVEGRKTPPVVGKLDDGAAQ